MGEIPSLTVGSIRDLARPQSFDRGESYFERGRVGTIVGRGERLTASVEGSQPRPYSVLVDIDETGVTFADCSCPYDYGGICKHCVAVLLTAVRDPERIVHRQPLEDHIEQADSAVLADVLLSIVEDHPELAPRVETRLHTSGVDDAEATDSKIAVDLDAIRVGASQALPKPGKRGHTDGHAEARRMASDLDDLLEQARLVLDAGDGSTALDVLEVITDVLLSNSWIGLPCNSERVPPFP